MFSKNPIKFADLPEWLRDFVMTIRSDNFDDWIHTPVPALQQRSVAELFASGEEGKQELRQYVNKVKGYLR